MNNTANGGRKCIEYKKDGITHFIRFNVVKNNRTQTSYCNVWDGETRLFQTQEFSRMESEKTVSQAKTRLLDLGYKL